MRSNNVKVLLSTLVFAGFSVAATPTVTPPAQQQKAAPVVTPKPKHHKPVVDDDDVQQDPSRTVFYKRGQTVTVRTQKHFVTVVQIPGELITGIVGGDNDNWAANLNKTQTVLVIRPKNSAPHNAKTGIVVNTDHGNVYMIDAVLSSSGHDDLITIKPADTDMKKAASDEPIFVPVAVVTTLKSELASRDRQVDEIKSAADERVKTAEAQVADANKRADEQIEKFRVSYPTKMAFDYKFKAFKSPFNIEAVWRDDRFTYILADPDEVCAVYAEKDGRPMIVDATYKDGLYTLPGKYYGDFYLQAGKKKEMIKSREK